MNQKFQIVMKPDTHRRLKALAAISGLSIGDTLHALLDRLEEKGRTVQTRLADAGLTSYAEQMPLSLGLMKDSTLASLLREPPEGLAQKPEWGPAGNEER
ncbi:hypothetical protein HNR65_003445 [Desulfosalsimonas propionicica]|uniref:Uncharacterized protein n=1 Tax=Desulfosalsimonas propionicica TaxID=332175 RepID=A0A7W0CCA8_9BACT|nr:hypothetical protein [Desulfosalsimonas propionicica]MBA2883088.1 hypothetical protein [Desulfosalsimonas propionicica]